MTVAKNSRGGGADALLSEGRELARAPLEIPRDQKLAMWGPGPWVDEPDFREGITRGIPWCLRRSPLGTWCGYVRVEPGHPWHGAALHKAGASVHGGVTWSATDPVADAWWIGFDCGHANDLQPGLESVRRKAREHNSGLHEALTALESLVGAGEYRDHDYALSEVVDLAEQAAAAGAGSR